MNLKSYIYSLIAGVVAVCLSACSPDDIGLGAKDLTPDDLAEGIAYSITKDGANPNIVYLESLLPDSYTPLWEHPQGRSQAKKVTLKIPFDGTYTVKFGVETRGGVVYGTPVTFQIDAFCADFVSGEMWDFLAGGAGHSKTWVPDNGNYGMKQGFYSCYDPSATYENMVSDNGTNWYADGLTWWEPSNSDIGITANDLNSYMTFSLDGKAGLTTYRANGDQITQTEGMFSMNTDNHTISAIDVDFIHGEWANNFAVDYRNGFQILVLTENQLMIANYRDPVLSGEGRCIYCWNFVSKEYADNYVPPTVDNSNIVPELPTDWRDYVEPKTNKVITYKLSDETPFDWCDLYGKQKGNTSFAAAPGIEDMTLVLNSGSGEYQLTTPEGDEYTGKYTLSADGIYTFSDVLPAITLSQDGKVAFHTNQDGTLRIMSYEVDDYSGALTDLWIGSKETDDQGKLYQYQAYHWVAQTAGAQEKRYTANINFFDSNFTFINGANVYITGDGDYTFVIDSTINPDVNISNPYGIYLDVLKILKDYPNMDIAIKTIKVDGQSIAFDDTLIDRGTGDAETTARRYILNPWGPTAGDAPKYAFTSTIEVTIAVKLDNGTPFIPQEEE